MVEREACERSKDRTEDGVWIDDPGDRDTDDKRASDKGPDVAPITTTGASFETVGVAIGVEGGAREGFGNLVEIE
jgi:hypothetical protein